MCPTAGSIGAPAPLHFQIQLGRGLSDGGRRLGGVPGGAPVRPAGVQAVGASSKAERPDCVVADRRPQGWETVTKIRGGVCGRNPTRTSRAVSGVASTGGFSSRCDGRTTCSASGELP
eukprot:2557816-Heterocapsa_arctica.AAC.1